MPRKVDSIVSIEVIQPDLISAREFIIVVTWGDNTKSLWFESKTPKYVLEMMHECNAKVLFKKRTLASFLAQTSN